MSIRDKVSKLAGASTLETFNAPGIGEVFLRRMSAAEFDKLIAGVKSQHGGDIQRRGNWRAWLVSQVLCESDGSRVFGDGEEGFLGQLPSSTIQSLYDRFCAMNGLGDDAQKELEKNSDGMPDDASPSASHLS